MRPTNKQELISFIKRKLGYPYVAIEISPEQFDDVLDQSLLWYTQNIDEGQINKFYSLDISSGASNYDLTTLVPNIYTVYKIKINLLNIYVAYQSYI